MVFSSVDFLFLFLPVFLLTQIAFANRNITFVLFSLLFYFVGEGWYSAIVIVSVVMNYRFGLLIADQDDPRRKRIALGVSVASNLALLFFFKYAGFFWTSIWTTHKWGWITSIHLPLGISFFTFHAISYLVDIYRGDAKAERSFINLSLYILMFPQLIAGPILQFHTVANQLRRRTVTARRVYYGMTLFSFGLAQKVLLADTMASIADPLFARWQHLSVMDSWLAAIAYSLQIFHDFAGYSNMAIGLGWVTGFFFPSNFNYPYVSKSITEFWRRWHMSLSRWFRNYLYIPLGGNRSGKLRTYCNLFIVFLLCGLWHGAAWTFVLWGCYHGLLLVIERLGLERALQRLPAGVQHLYALLAIIIGWVLFRSDSTHQAGTILAKMFLLSSAPDANPLFQVLSGEQFVALLFSLLFATPFVSHLMRRWLAMPIRPPWPSLVPSWAYGAGALSAVAVWSIAAVKVLTGAYSPFIYFRF